MSKQIIFTTSSLTSGGATILQSWINREDIQSWMKNLWESQGKPNQRQNTTEFIQTPLELSIQNLNDLDTFLNNSDDSTKIQNIISTTANKTIKIVYSYIS